MNGHRFISPRAHGVLDYLTGLALLAAPFLFDFDEVGGAAVAVPIVLGLIILAQALLTDYEMGLIKILPFNAHLAIDYILGPLLALSPFLFGFADNPANVWLPHVLVGLTLLLITLFTRTRPREIAQQR